MKSQDIVKKLLDEPGVYFFKGPRGKIVAKGTPEKVVKKGTGHTANYLANVLKI